MRITHIACLAALCAAALAAPAQAANRIEGTWGFGKGRVEVTPAGTGLYKGIVVRKLKFAHCNHPVGERMWKLFALRNGTYRGTHVNYIRSTCERDPGAFGLWRVRKQGRKELLDMCVNPPGKKAPTTFTGNCNVLTRIAPARDLARACAAGPVRASASRRDVCIEGPRELRRTGCVRRRKGVVHRFRAELLQRSGRPGLVGPGTRIASVEFKLDRRRKRTDRRAPFRFSVKGAELKPGAHVLVAQVGLRVSGGRQRGRRVAFKFDACA